VDRQNKSVETTGIGSIVVRRGLSKPCRVIEDQSFLNSSIHILVH
jgi:hypothetical protein